MSAAAVSAASHRDQKKARVAHLRDKRFDSDSDDEDGPSVQPAVTKAATATNSSIAIDVEERCAACMPLPASRCLHAAQSAGDSVCRKRLAAERARQLDLLTASVAVEPEVTLTLTLTLTLPLCPLNLRCACAVSECSE